MNEHNPSVAPHSDIDGTVNPQTRQGVLVCSFCGLGEGEVARLFEGYSGYICDECVDVCVQLLHDYREMGLRPPRPSRPWYKKLFGDDAPQAGTCSFNIHDRDNPQGERLFPGIHAQICDKCVRACEVLKSSLLLGG
ncbi:MAG: ClpX C4-type zinc finger protein [Acidobacteria bacterium]|nr:ClpX C4-type zinc finger protein [Acidobacteriota bacterium]